MIKRIREKMNDFKFVRWMINSNLVLQLLLIVLLLIGLNVIFLQFYLRKDFSANNRYSLSPETIAYVKKLPMEKVSIIFFANKHSNKSDEKKFYEDINFLLKEFKYCVQKNKDINLKIETIDIHLQPGRMELIAKKYGIEKKPCLLVTSDLKMHLLEPLDFYGSKNGKIEQFQGEIAIMRALLDVLNEKKLTIYFTEGHGEMSPFSHDTNKGLSEVCNFLSQRNFDIKTLNLVLTEDIPENADLIAIVGPQSPFLRMEEEKLKTFLTKKHGNVLVLLDPIKKHGLDNLFFDHGILAHERIIVEPEMHSQTSSGVLLIRRYEKHPITQSLIDIQLPVLLELCRPISVDIGSNSYSSSIHNILPLLFTSESSWGKKFYETSDFEKVDWSFNNSTDLKGPLSIAVLSEKMQENKLGIKMPFESMIVIGNSEFVGNRQISILGNKIFFLNSIQWLMKKTDTLNIIPKSFQTFQMQISSKDLLFASLYLLILPILTALFGIIVFIFRKR